MVTFDLKYLNFSFLNCELYKDAVCYYVGWLASGVAFLSNPIDGKTRIGLFLFSLNVL